MKRSSMAAPKAENPFAITSNENGFAFGTATCLCVHEPNGFPLVIGVAAGLVSVYRAKPETIAAGVFTEYRTWKLNGKS